ncbi:MAG: GNAT family N-acetyltransferase [Actinocrinis sp.]
MGVRIPVSLAEHIEAESLFDLEDAMPEPIRRALGLATLRVGGGVALAVPNDPTRFWSRVLGLGLDEPITARLIGQVCAFFRSHGMPSVTIQVAPSVLPDDWEAICARENIAPGTSWVKLAADVETVLANVNERPELAGHLRLAAVTADHAPQWAETMLTAFGMPIGPLTDMAAAVVGRPDWHAFAVWDGDAIVAGAQSYVYGEAASMFGAATLPGARGHGAQTALITARANAAAHAGCRWLVGETGAEAEGDHNSSLHNMLRLGFDVLYERRNWIWNAEG